MFYLNNRKTAFGLIIEVFWENLISPPPGIIICLGRLPASFISCWTWPYGEEHVGEEHVGITGGTGHIRLVQLAGSSAKVGACV